MLNEFEDCILYKAANVPIGATIVFSQNAANYRVDSVEITGIGMVRHRYEEGSTSYWPHELVYVSQRRA